MGYFFGVFSFVLVLFFRFVLCFERRFIFVFLDGKGRS